MSPWFRPEFIKETLVAVPEPSDAVLDNNISELSAIEPFPMPRPFPGIGGMPVFGRPAQPGIFGGLPKFLLDRIGRRQGMDRAYQIPEAIAGLPSIFG